MKWAVVGVGLAGRARARAIVADPRCQLAAVWRGRFAAEVGAPVVATFEDALAEADAVAICSPTALHPEQVRAVLEAGRHCVVEFPVAPDPDTAAGLFALARERGLVLHVEHIELLDAPGATLRAHVRPEFAQEVAVDFEQAGPEEVGPAELALGNVARLHRLVAIGGPVARIDRVDASPGRLAAELVLESGAPVRCTFRQGPYYSRKTRIEVRTPGVHWQQENDVLLRNGQATTLLGQGALFQRDQRVAVARILDGAAPYVTEARILHVLDVTVRLGALVTGPVPHRSDAGATA